MLTPAEFGFTWALNGTYKFSEPQPFLLSNSITKQIIFENYVKNPTQALHYKHVLNDPFIKFKNSTRHLIEILLVHG